MLNLAHREGARTQLRIIDVPLGSAWQRLVVDEGGLDLLSLPAPPDEPTDEREPGFMLALERLRRGDAEWQRIVADDPDLSTASTRRLDRALRDRVRVELGLRPFVAGRLPGSLADHARAHGIDPAFELAIAGEKARALRTLLLPESHGAKAEAVARQARSAEQETGAGTLYAAFGFLEWFEAAESDRPLHAPLILLPVAIEKVRRGARKVFEVTAGGDEPSANISLERRLARDFGLVLPAFRPETAEPVAGYFDAVADAVRDRRGWRVRHWLTLAHLSFAKLAMWRDLDPDRWPADRQPAAKALVREVLRGPAVAGDGLGFADEHAIDDPAVEASAPVLVHDADSSQHSAIIDVMRGKNLVVEGPPGTGKSQTIANLIANAIHAGQKVLFVAEKQAALTVVKSRLDAAGLGEFCLELHSAKTKPAAVVANLKARAELRGQPAQPAPAKALAATRDTLNAYGRALHQTRTAGRENVFQLFWRERAAADALGDAAASEALVTVDLAEAADWDEAQLAARRLIIRELATAASAWAAEGNAQAAATLGALRLDDVDPLFGGPEVEMAAGRLLSSVGRLAGLGGRLPLPERDRLSVAQLSALADGLARLPRPPTEADDDLLRELLTPGFKARLSEAALHLETIEGIDRLLAVAARPRIDAGTVGQVLALAQREGLEDAPVGTFAARAADAARLALTARALADRVRPVLVALSAPVRLGPDDLTLIETAARLVSEADGSVLALRRPGLASRLPELERLQPRAAEVRAERERLGKWVSLDALPTEELRTLAEKAAKRGLLGTGLFNGEANTARARLAETCPALAKVSRDELSALLDAVLRCRRSGDALLDGAAGMRDLAGSTWRGLDTPWGELRNAAGWQARVEAALPAAGTGLGPHLRRALLQAPAEALQPLRRLLRTPLDKASLDDPLDLSEEGVGELEAQARRLIGLAQAVRGLDRAASAAEHAVWLDEQRRRETAGEQREIASMSLASLSLPARLVDGTAPERASAEIRELLGFADVLTSLRLPEALVPVVLSHYRLTRSELVGLGEELAGACGEVAEATGELTRLVAPDWRRLGEADAPERMRLDDLVRAAGTIRAALGRLKAWSALARAREAATGAGLAPLMPHVETLAVAGGPVDAALERSVARSVLRAVRRNEAGKAPFTPGSQLEGFREEFRQRDRRKLLADRELVRATALRARPPSGSNFGLKKTWTEMALLNNEFGKQQRFFRLRDLMARAPAAIRELTPCLMMSPMAVAQYLEPGLPEFDLVVIDEASQMRPEDALGAVLRAKRFVVVGDPKQLPPTSFFDRQQAEETGDDAPEDEEVEGGSILDLCLGSFRPARRLRWHYRSRHESLIAFSNRHLYDDRLIIFPSRVAQHALLGVELVEVDGRYEAGREKRVNVKEAVAVAETAMRLLRERRDLTVGVVAVNEPQARLIEQEIRLRARGDEVLEAALDPGPDELEPFFVKNLENVQGDERDVILVSLTYGPSPEGAVHQRFGPIAGRFGHRRLNVLFTRARRKLVLFSSLRPEQIVVGPNSGPGVGLLRDYLRYVRTGRLDGGEATGRPPDSDFERAVASRLGARGYEVDCQVGVGGYRLDLAVRDPGRPGDYLAGVECDGATWHSARSARDRDRLRQDALEALGWTILRIWSTDWFADPEEAADKLASQLEAARRERTDPLPPRLVALIVEADGREMLSHTTEASEPQPTPAPSGPTAIPRATSRTLDEDTTAEAITRRLRRFRDEVIFGDLPGSEPDRCILREALLREVIKNRLDDPDDFAMKIPLYLRTGTDGRQIRYLPDICGIVAEMDGSPDTAKPNIGQAGHPAEPSRVSASVPG